MLICFQLDLVTHKQLVLNMSDLILGSQDVLMGKQAIKCAYWLFFFGPNLQFIPKIKTKFLALFC